MCEEIDPRIQINLEKLNTATESINQYEFELQRTRCEFKSLISDTAVKMESLRNRLGLCIERAKPYYESRFFVNENVKDVQRTSQQLEKTFSAHNAAKEMVSLAEQGIGNQILDHAWQEMLNHAIQRVNETDNEHEMALNEFRFATIRHEAASLRVKNLQKDLKRSLLKSRPYYEMKAKFIEQVQKQKNKVDDLKSAISNSKQQYSETLKCLEKISEEIHKKRQNDDLDLSFEKLSLSNENLHFSKCLTNQPFSNLNLLESQSHCGQCQSLMQLSNYNMDTSELWNEVTMNDGNNDDMHVSQIEDMSMGSRQTESPKLKRRQSLDSIRDFLSYGVMKFNSNFNNVLERRSSEPKFFDKCSSSSFIKSFSFQKQDDELSDTESILSIDGLSDNQIKYLILENDINQICQKVFGEDYLNDM